MVGQRTALLGLLALGAAVRMVLAVKLPATQDIESARLVADIVGDQGFAAYGSFTKFDPILNPFDYRLFPYPPGFLPWLLLADLFPPGWFPVIERLAPIAADGVLVWLVIGELRARGGSERQVAWAVALIWLGPVFIAVSAVNGQIDSLAMVFVLLALRIWRVSAASRPWLIGLVLGVGICVKTVPIIFVLPLVLATGRAAATRIAAGAAVVPVLALLPFLLNDVDGVIRALTYSGFAGGGGWSLLADPELASHYLTDHDVRTTGVAAWLVGHGVAITLAAVLAAATWLRARHIPPLDASIVVALVVLLSAVNFYEQYLLWLLPIALALGRVVLVATIQAVMVPYLWVTGAIPRAASVWWPPVSDRAHIQIGCIVVLMLILAAGLVREIRASEERAAAWPARNQ